MERQCRIGDYDALRPLTIKTLHLIITILCVSTLTEPVSKSVTLFLKLDGILILPEIICFKLRSKGFSYLRRVVLSFDKCKLTYIDTILCSW